MRKCVFLFGAGASVDAGLPTSFGLSQTLYNVYKQDASSEAKIYRFVYSELVKASIARGVDNPFDQDIEVIFDTIERFQNRERDPLYKFINSWDFELEDAFQQPLPKDLFEYSIGEFVKKIVKDEPYPKLELHLSDLEKLQRLLQRKPLKATGALFGSSEGPLTSILQALKKVLDVSEKDVGYFHKVVEYAERSRSTLATLNYDLSLEKACEEMNLDYSAGIENWHENGQLSFRDKAVQLIKLHGSVDWLSSSFKRPQDLAWSAPNVPAIIFGASSNKLSPTGPYLELRQQFWEELDDASALCIVGYSYRDDHINLMLESWFKRRKNRDIFVVDPRPPKFTDALESRVSNSNTAKTRFHRIEKCAAEGLPEVLAQLGN